MTAAVVHDILLRPVISEKSTVQAERNTYAFSVAPEANKLQVRRAVERAFSVSVVGVRIISVKPKQKRRGRRTPGMIPGWKKALVTIAEGQKIELFEAV